MFPVTYLMSFFDDTVQASTERQISILDVHTGSEYTSRTLPGYMFTVALYHDSIQQRINGGLQRRDLWAWYVEAIGIWIPLEMSAVVGYLDQVNEVNGERGN